MNYGLAIAGLFAAMTAIVHIMIGGKEVAQPLRNRILVENHADANARTEAATLWFCWHIVSITLIGLAFCLGLGAVLPGYRPLAVAALVLSAAVAFLGLGTTIAFHLPWKMLPQWIAFAMIDAVALPGLMQPSD